MLIKINIEKARKALEEYETFCKENRRIEYLDKYFAAIDIAVANGETSVYFNEDEANALKEYLK